MPRPVTHSPERMLETTREVVAALGPAGASVQKIAERLGAPTGSIYHRFRSRDALLGEVWLQTTADFQRQVRTLLDGDDPVSAGLEAALYVPRWVREEPAAGSIVVMYRSDEFLSAKWPAALRRRAAALRADLAGGLRAFSIRLFGSDSDEAVARTRYVLADAPVAAVKPYLRGGKTPPPLVDGLITATYRSVLAFAERDDPS